MSRRETSVATLIIAIACVQPFSTSQDSKKLRAPRQRELALRIIPSKTTYDVQEKLLARCELTNLTDETVCFPPPADGCYFTMSAWLPNPDGTPGGMGTGIGCGSEDAGSHDLLSNVEKKWVKLPPNQTHLAECLTGIELARSGRWRVSVTYHPPKMGSEEKSVLKSVGCKLPEADISSRPIEIDIDEQPR